MSLEKITKMTNSITYLSWILDKSSPSYGDREKFEMIKTSSIVNGDAGNHTKITTSMHIGTHIDMPYHFFDNGQTIEDFDAGFWIFNKISFIEIQPKDFIIKDELIEKLDTVDEDIEILIVKTGATYQRNETAFMTQNYGFDPILANELRRRFKFLRIFGFDSISVSSFTNRLLGREAHREFLNPEHPIILLEDMKLDMITLESNFDKIIVSPLRIKNSDGLPATVFALME